MPLVRAAFYLPKSRLHIICNAIYNLFTEPPTTMQLPKPGGGFAIAIFNAKGGVGKTSTAYNLAIALSRFHNKRVLLIDIDPQGHAGVSLGINVANLENRIEDVLQGKIRVSKAIYELEEVDVIPSNILLAMAEIPISGIPGRENLLRRAIANIRHRYDFILIDCPPNVGIFAVNAWMAANAILVPVDASYLGLLGLPVIQWMKDLINEQLEHPVQLLGVVATRYDGRLRMSRDTLDTLREHFGDKMFSAVIPERADIRSAPSHQKPIFDHAPGSDGALAYELLATEVCDRVYS